MSAEPPSINRSKKVVRKKENTSVPKRTKRKASGGSIGMGANTNEDDTHH